MTEWKDCPHMLVTCYCGAPPNSPDCKEQPQMETCRLQSEAHGLAPCDQDSEDAQHCFRYQRARAECAEGVVGLLVEALRYARDYVPVSARAQTMEPTTLPSTYYIYGRKPLHPVITAALAAAAALAAIEEAK